MPRWPRSNPPVVHAVLPYAPGNPTRRTWKRVVLALGPEPKMVPPTSPRTLEALQRHGVLHYRVGEQITMAWLTPAGMRLRDRWIRLAAVKYERRIRAQKSTETG